MKKRYIVLLIVLFILVLSTGRFLWVQTLHHPAKVKITNGELHLSTQQLNDRNVFLLDGEWEFYPSQFLFDGTGEKVARTAEMNYMEVPGGWNEFLYEDKVSPFGYGSYRLRIHVAEEDDTTYSVYVPSVRSSSELYVNGRLLDGSGVVATSQESYRSDNIPYIASFTVDENGTIDIVIQAANFKDVRNSGLIRSLKFGTEAALKKERNLSITMQVFGAAIFILHALYAIILYVLGNRDKKLLFFSLVVFSFTISQLISSDDKILTLLFSMDYDWGFRLANALSLVGCFALFHSVEQRSLPYQRIVKPVISSVLLILAFITLLLSPGQIMQVFPVYYTFGGLAIVITIISVSRTIFQNIGRNLLLFLSLIAVIHHFYWLYTWTNSGYSVTHYPFDMAVAVGCLAAVWFKDYFTMYKETKRMAAELQEINRNKDRFLANTAHEFKNPLHGMINMAQAILRREKTMLQEKSVHELEVITSIGRRMSLLLNDLLDVASLQEGTPRLKKSSVSLLSTTTGVIDMLQFIIDAKPIQMKNEIDDNFPNVLADENRLIQIMFNLLHNALKFTDEGEITISAEVKDDKAYISISDTGVGMDEEFLSRLYLPYEQAVRAEDSEGGLGLGLSISKQLIEIHGGDLHVTSEVSKGSTFTFSLPLASVEDEEENEAYISEEQTGNDSEEKELEAVYSDIVAKRVSGVDERLEGNIGKHQAILIVDDDPINLEVLESVLTDVNYDVVTALNGEEALEKLAEKDWSLMIVDVMMPKMSGYELTKLIREKYSLTELPILILTARNNQKDIQTGFLAGANDYVTKPVEMVELLSRVKTLTTVKHAVKDRVKLEAAWLQAQIQPHFLFNTLNSIGALSEIDTDQMRDLINEFSSYLRSKYRYTNMDELIPLEDELAIVRSYLNIEQVRFGNRLNVEWDIPDDIHIKVPFLSIQPLVENAVKHGVMKKARGGTVKIQVVPNEVGATITVSDTGVGMDQDKVEQLLISEDIDEHGVGIVNTNKRLVRHFGEGLKFVSKAGEGTTVSFVVHEMSHN